MPDRSSRSDREPELLEYLCDACRTAFGADDPNCPNCERDRPGEGWRRVRNYPDAWLGRTVGERYQLRQRMGEGAVGAVYRASRLHLDDNYAVKIIRLEDAEVEGDGRSPRNAISRDRSPRSCSRCSAKMPPNGPSRWTTCCGR